MVDLSQDQDESAGPLDTAAEHGPTLGKDSREEDSGGPATDSEAKSQLKPADAEQHSQSTGKKRSVRPPRNRKEALQDAVGAADPNCDQQRTKKQHSKSGVEVEMEEI